MRHHKAGRTMLGMWTAEQQSVIRASRSFLWALAVVTLALPGYAAAQATDPNAAICSYGFLDLDDPHVVAGTNEVAMLTFACFDEDDSLLWTRGFASVDAWCTYARNDPNLSAHKTEQTGWALCLGDE